MDPQILLFNALEAMQDDNKQEAIAYLESLIIWMKKEGFCPQVERTSLVGGLVVYRDVYNKGV